MNHNKINGYIFLVVLIIAAYISFLILKPFISAILGALILTYIFYPLYSALRNKLKNKHIAAALIIILTLIIILLPLIFIFNVLAQETGSVYSEIKSRDFSILISEYFEGGTLDIIQQIIDRSIFFLVELTSDVVLSIPGLILNLVVVLFLTYFFLQSKEPILRTISSILPFKGKEKEALSNKFEKTTHALIYGTLLAALAQGVAGGIGFYLLGLPSPLFWGFVMFLLAIIPVGPGFVWLPTSIFLLATGNIFNGVALLLYGFLIISTIDNLIKINFVGSKAKVNQATILLGVLGGLKLLGIVGTIIGPLVLALVVEYIKIKTSSE